MSHRSRLSLDLSSPTITNTAIDQTKLAITPTTPTTKSPSVTKLNTPTSPSVANSAPFPSRYTEFKTYSSTFDGLQALESHSGSNNVVTAINGGRTTPQVTLSPDNPLMRVSSLPAMIAPQNQLAGNYLCITKLTNSVVERCNSLSLMKAHLSSTNWNIIRQHHDLTSPLLVRFILWLSNGMKAKGGLCQVLQVTRASS